MKPSNMQPNVDAGRVFSVGGLPELEVSNTLDFRIFDLTRAQTMIVSDIRDKDPRPYLNILQQINTIPDPNWRQRVLARLDDLLEDHDFRSVEGHIACIMVSGAVTDWQAKYRPVVSYNLVGKE
ncbi:MAG: hypothetical protein O0X96_05725 [Methanocorpusculum sp.]|nr:hypothetical protein [Methanocorpusculum sp.]MDE2524610.1 hypothetical protein [Methanocorpusculum sp.]